MFAWPNDSHAALSLTFDDGRGDQFDIVVPELDKRGLRGTFYLNPRGSIEPNAGDYFLNKLARWQSVAERGHEMGNHTISHPCSLNVDLGWNRPSSRDLTFEEIACDIDEAQRRLSIAFPHQKCTSFAYPCYESDVGQGLDRKSYVPHVADRFIAARARGEYPNQPGVCDLHHLSSWNMEKKSTEEMVALVIETIQSGHWGIFTFHGVGQDRLSVLYKDFVGLLDHLTAVQDQLWVASVADVGAFVSQELN